MKIALLGYGKMGREIEKIALERGHSIVIKADALHYQTDLWSNAAVLVALGLVYFTGLDAIDAIFGLVIKVRSFYPEVAERKT